MTILGTTKVDSRFRVTIPKEVRDFLKLEAGHELVLFTVEGMKGRVCFRKS